MRKGRVFRIDRAKAHARILSEMREAPYISLEYIGAALDVSKCTSYKLVRELRNAGKVRRKGPNNGGEWVVLDKGKELIK